jgi:hypothetical protein
MNLFPEAEAKLVWHEILRNTLKGDDLAKLDNDDNELNR